MNSDMNRIFTENRKHLPIGKPESKKSIVIVVSVVAFLVLCHFLAVSLLDRYPWIFGGSGAPDVISLGNGYRLEKVIALRKGYFVKDVRGGRMIFGRTAGRNSGEINGAADLGGNVIVPLGAHDDDIWLTVGENGAVYETIEPYTASDREDDPVETVIDGSGRTAICYDVNGCRLVSYDGALGINGTDGAVETLLGSGSGKGWRLEDPRFFGEYAVVRIYWCDCVYRVARDED